MNNEDYQLISLSEEHFPKLHRWMLAEKHMDHYSCRPYQFQHSEDDYANKIKNTINGSSGSYYVLVATNNHDEPLGKIRSFDYNPRNHSAEFGYYLPEQNRHKGLGSIMLRQFIRISFADSRYDLNKLYATTSSNNTPSVKLLEKFGFKIDGRQREHYWIDGNRYDQLIFSILRSELPDDLLI